MMKHFNLTFSQNTSARIPVALKLLSILTCLLLCVPLFSQQNCNSPTDPVTGCNIMYCDGSMCDDLVPADGVSTCTSCMPCGVASPPSDRYACARVELDVTGTDEYMNDPTLAGCELEFDTQENGNFDFYFNDGSVNCGTPDFTVEDGDMLPITVVTAGMVELIICKTGGSGRRDLNILLSCCEPTADCIDLDPIDEEGCDIPDPFTDYNDVFTNVESCGADITMDSDDDGDTDVCGDGDGADFTRTYTLYFDGVAVETCDQEIMIEDTTAPVVDCPEFTQTFPSCPSGFGPNTPNGFWGSVPGNGIIMSAFGGGAFVVPADISNCVSDCSDLSDLEFSLIDGYIESSVPGCSLTLVNELVIRDECGNVSDDRIIIRAIIEHQQNSPPVIVCPANLTVECGDSTDPADTGEATATDDCGTAAVTFADNFTPSCGSGTGMISRVWTATDGCGETATCTQVITIVDTTPPSITCPANATVECGGSTAPADTGTATGSDACGTVAITFSDNSSPGCGNTETITRTWTATDACGNPSTCTQIITVVDTTPPSITCPANVTVECGDSTSPDVTGNATASDGCGGVSISSSDAFTASCGSGTGMISRTWTATDDCGNPSTCTQIITIVDTTPPSITCPPDATVECGNSTAPADTGTATGSDTCGSVSITFSDSSVPGCGNTETITRTWTATDQCGNPTTCTQIITVVDTTPPVIVCPANMTLECGSPTDIGSTGTATGTDACGTVAITFNDAFTPGCGSGTGMIARTFTATDECGNPSTCTQIITLVDNTAPVFDPTCQIDATFTTEDGNVCPAEASISLSEGDELTVDDGWVVGGISIPPLRGCVSDNCENDDNITITVDDITITGDDCERTITVTFLASDPCGNISDPFICNYTFIDNTAPVFDLTCQIDATFFTEDGNVCPADATISLNEGDELTVDDGWVVGGISIPPLRGCVSDNCADDDDLIIIVDDITITGDDCERTITVTFLADDGCGNISDPFVCNYTFIDNTAPVVNYQGLPDGSTVDRECNNADPNDNPFITIDELTIFDNCADFADLDITMEDELIAEGVCGVDDFLSLWRCTFTVVDPCGNTTVYNIFIRIVDTTPPSFDFFPPDVAISCEEEIPASTATATDICSEVEISYSDQRIDGNCPNNYTIRRTFVAVDGCGNPVQRVQLIEVSDTTPPEIVFEDEYINGYVNGQDVYTECTEYINIFKLRYATRADDNCSDDLEVEFEFEDFGGFDCAEFGYSGHLRTTWTSTDECGNTGSAFINWYLVDETAPTLQGIPDDICASSMPPVPNNIQAVDECEFAILTFSQSDPIDCDGGSYVERTWTATDICGNSASATQRITLNNGSGPAVNVNYPGLAGLPSGSTAQLAADCNNEGAQLPDLDSAVEVNGSCAAAEATSSVELLATGSCNADGFLARYRLKVVAQDVCGNTTDYDLFIELIDNTPPVVTAPASIVVNCGDGIPIPEAYDACGDIASVTVVDDTPLIVSCVDELVYQTQVWIITDNCGNSTTFEQEVAVQDKEGPTFSNIPADACNDTSLDGVVTAFDECAGENVAVQFSETTTNEAGCGEVLTRLWTAVDACGNVSSAMQQVFFTDSQAPSLSFAHPLLVNLENGDELRLTVGSGYGGPANPFNFGGTQGVTVTDNCASNIIPVQGIQNMLNFDCEEVGYLSRHRIGWMATDPCGNSRYISIILIYEDIFGPDIFNVPGDLVLYCDAPVPPPASVFVEDDYDQDVNVGFDQQTVDTDFGVRIIRTWTATDDCGNTNSESQNIDIYDNTIACEFDFPDIIDCHSENNLISVIASGGYPPYTYEWEMTDCDGFITSDNDGPSILYTVGYTTQNFSVTITDSEGCERVCSTSIVCEKDEGNQQIVIDNSGSTTFGINVYPNPADQLLKVTFSEGVDQPATVGLYSLFGQELFRKQMQEFPAEGLEIDTQRLPNGTYLLRIECEGQAPVSREIVIIH